MGKLSYDKLRMQTLRQQGLRAKATFPVTLTTGGNWVLLRKSAVELTALAQPFCVNQAVRDLPRHFHFMREYSKLDRVKTMDTRGKLNAVWWNIKINLQRLVDIPFLSCFFSWYNKFIHSFIYVDMNCQQMGGYFFYETPCSYKSLSSSF